MKKKTRITLASLAIVGVLLVGGTLAYFTDTDTKTNVVTMGNVNGTLDEESNDGTETDEGYEYDDVKPGDELDKQPDVTLGADSEDAYVRVKVEVVNAVDATKQLDDESLEAILDNLTGTSTKWKVVDETDGDGVAYYYYQEKLTAGQTTDKVFTTVVVPTNWTNEQADCKFEIKLTAELIQADNFVPTTDNGIIVGWGDVDIEPASEEAN